MHRPYELRRLTAHRRATANLEAAREQNIACALREAGGGISKEPVWITVATVAAAIAAFASAYLAYVQSGIADDAPLQQALATKRIEGCGEILRTSAIARNRIDALLRAYAGTPKRVPTGDIQELEAAFHAVDAAMDEHEVFFAQRQQVELGNAKAILLQNQIIQNAKQKGDIGNFPATAVDDKMLSVDDSIQSLKVMCWGVADPNYSK